MNLRALPAFSDNYIWMLDHDGHALVVDPGDANPVLNFLQTHGLQLDAILVTHHHPDHTAGINVLRQTTGAKVYGPRRESIPQPAQGMGADDQLSLLRLNLEVMDVPGHTAGHIAWYCPSVTLSQGNVPVLFCGDTLFSGGCGRLFEGTAAQMWQSLQSIMALPDNTLVCCTHEYTLSNLKFAIAVEPDNTDLIAYQKQCATLREKNLPTLPSHLALEKRINPFLRPHSKTVRHIAQQRDPKANDEPSVFAVLREWKNNF
jgi:hydroxyacylglutathione hydrolase